MEPEKVTLKFKSILVLSSQTDTTRSGRYTFSRTATVYDTSSVMNHTLILPKSQTREPGLAAAFWFFIINVFVVLVITSSPLTAGQVYGNLWFWIGCVIVCATAATISGESTTLIKMHMRQHALGVRGINLQKDDKIECIFDADWDSFAEKLGATCHIEAAPVKAAPSAERKDIDSQPVPLSLSERLCENCNAKYDISSYDPLAPAWFCDRCKASVPKESM